MAIAVNDIVTVNTSFLQNTLAARSMNPTIRQTITSLERLSNVQSTILGRGWINKYNGDILYHVKIVPNDPKHLLYRPPFDGEGRGITVYFTSVADLEASFNRVG